MVDAMLLGEKTGYPDRYAPGLLQPISRRENRRSLGIDGALPFRGADLWNAWEITWLDRRGTPAVAVGRLRVPADSTSLFESKSLKLYLNSFAMTAFDSADDVRATIVRDLSRVTESAVEVELEGPGAVRSAGIGELPGSCIDDIAVECRAYEVDSAPLSADAGRPVREELHSHLFRSNCPVTAQPDYGSILVRYRGGAIARAGLLRYLVSYRRHSAFHESCIERIFVDLKARCEPAELTVAGCFNRRGGVDINPFRSDFEDALPIPRLWRQ
jgi:7-cyano-7-deazaguanine reductase